MDIWSILQIERTTDKKKIKRAYARLAAQFHPEEQPEEFQRIYAAYEEALRYAESGGRPSCLVMSNLDNQFLYNEKTENNRPDIDFNQYDIQPEKYEARQEEEKIDFDELIKQEAKPNLSLNRQDSNLDFSVLNNLEDETVSTVEIDSLIGRFRILMYDEEDRKKLGKWKRLLGDVSFLHLHQEREFLMKFTVMFREVQLTQKVSRLIYNAIDFPVVEQLYEYEVYRELKENLLLDIKGKRRLVKYSDVHENFSVVYWIGGFLVFIIALVAQTIREQDTSTWVNYDFNERISAVMDSMIDDFEGNSSVDKDLEKYLKEHYKADFAVTAIGEPDDIMEVYYLMGKGKNISDYQWFMVNTQNVDIPVQFYASWSKDEGFRFDYSYRQMFAILESVGLANFIDDKDTYNMEYVKKDEQRYSYPVLFVEGGVVDGFCECLGTAADLIAETDFIFEGKEYVVLNIYNPHTGATYYLQIRQGEFVDKEAMQKEVEQIARGGS